MSMAVQWEYADGTLTVWLSGELDHHTARPLREQVDAAIERAVPRWLKLDFHGVTFMDSSGVGLVMGRYRLMKLLGGELRVVGASARVERMMRLAGLERLDIWEKEGGEQNEADQ